MGIQLKAHSGGIIIVGHFEEDGRRVAAHNRAARKAVRATDALAIRSIS